MQRNSNTDFLETLILMWLVSKRISEMVMFFGFQICIFNHLTSLKIKCQKLPCHVAVVTCIAPTRIPLGPVYKQEGQP